MSVLLATAAGLGATHALLGPDHGVSFAALALAARAGKRVGLQHCPGV